MTNKTIARIGTLLLLIVSAMAFPSLANASYLYTVTDNINQVSFSFNETTLASSGDVTSGFFNVTGGAVREFSWDSSTAEDLIFFNKPDGADSFPAGSFLRTGTYNSTDIDMYNGLPVMTVVIQGQAVPEPSVVALLGSGLLFVAGGLWRKQRLVAQTAR